MAEQKDNFQLDKKGLGKGQIISCIINQDGYMIALAYDHDKVVEYNRRWLEKEESSWNEEGLFSVPS
jgi:regulatory protein YycI of two-component signal transduction system YycFG